MNRPSTRNARRKRVRKPHFKLLFPGIEAGLLRVRAACERSGVALRGTVAVDPASDGSQLGLGFRTGLGGVDEERLVCLPGDGKLNAGFGAVSACVTGPTNALPTSSGTKHRQYTGAVVYKLLSLVCTLLAPTLSRYMLATPEAFILALGGLTMFKALQQAFVTAFSTGFTIGSLVAFVVTISDMKLFNIHAAFWGILIGFALSRMMEPHDHAAARLAS